MQCHISPYCQMEHLEHSTVRWSTCGALHCHFVYFYSLHQVVELGAVTCICQSCCSKTFLPVGLTSNLDFTDEDANLMLHSASDREPVPGLLRLDQSDLVDQHGGVGGHLGTPGRKQRLGPRIDVSC